MNQGKMAFGAITGVGIGSSEQYKQEGAMIFSDWLFRSAAGCNTACKCDEQRAV